MDATTLSANFDAREKATAELRTLGEQFAGKDMDADARAKEDKLLSAISDFDGRIKRGVEALKANEGVQSLMAQLDTGKGSGLTERGDTPSDADILRSLKVNEGTEFRAQLDKTSGSNALARGLYPQLMAQAVNRSAVMRSGATVFNTSDGNPLDFTVVTGRSTATIVGENAAIGESYPTTTQRSMGAYKYGYGATVSYEFATDQVLDLVGFLVGDAGPAIGDAMGRHFLTGTGTGQPKGIIPDGSAATATFSAAAAPTSAQSDALIDLSYELKSAYRSNATYLVSDKNAAKLRKLKDSTGQYLWQPSLQVGIPDTFNGRPITSDDGIPDDKIVFGDLSKYRVRFAGALRVDRSVDAKFATDQIVYRFLQRADGLLVDQTAVKVMTIAA
ncbi:phage major capsid protein [Streptomyces sp. NPDC086554]|uniref:phage major capsid protein n=1 Tax=Streptomyces sp. NPDC086554 TaxID=3154864 RepID=UPI00341EA103